MIPHWHIEMDVIMDGFGHRRREQDERKQEAREYLADAALISRLAEPHEVRWPGGGPWPPGCGKHRLLAPDCRDCASAYVLRDDEPVTITDGSGTHLAGCGCERCVYARELEEKAIRLIDEEMELIIGREPPPPPDPAEEIRAALAEPLGLDAGELTARIPDRPGGTCKDCRMPAPLPAADGQRLCSYCRSLAALKAAAPEPVPDRHRRPLAGATLLAAAGWACFLLGVKLADTWLLVAAVALWALTVRLFRESL